MKTKNKQIISFFPFPTRAQFSYLQIVLIGNEKKRALWCEIVIEDVEMKRGKTMGKASADESGLFEFGLGKNMKLIRFHFNFLVG